MQLYYHLLACCKDIVLQFGGQESSQKSMEGEYTYDKNSSNSRFDYNHVISNGKLSFHSAFSRWQVMFLWIVQYNTCLLQFKYTVIERYEIKVKYNLFNIGVERRKGNCIIKLLHQTLSRRLRRIFLGVEY